MKGFKAFDKNLQCRGFQFEVGQTFGVDGELSVCNNGFHFCEQLKDVYNYYPRSYDTRICMVDALGEVKTEEDKSCTSEIFILAELDKDEIKRLTDDLRFNSGNRNSGNRNSGDYNSGDYNSGDYNSGDCNSGDYNSGDCNSGYYNSGYYNSGYYNSGNRNSGNRNSGDCNSGDCNSGNRNSGNRNSGDCNSGYYNSGYYNSGYFNSDTPTVRLFNRDSGLSFTDCRFYRLNAIISNYWKPVLVWIWSNSMTEDEKKANPSHATTGGFLRKDSEYSYKKSWQNVWNQCSQDEKDLIKSLPNFDAAIFKEITGVEV
jgi:hypothetical protein